ncbi:MAG: TIR domain-containing protein [Steroidobacteraceae bacterium]
MTDPGQAVFLSYASQDAAAALQLCNALREAGVEVWFDQSELRGGDAWDASIRRQIKACTLFIPIISRHTHTRDEGYFRLEWKLAVDRSHLMVADRPFLLPVVIDDTSDQDEKVPDRFRDVQWTRLPGGQRADAFVERVRRLLSPDPTTPNATSVLSSALQTASMRAASTRSTPPPSRSFVAWIVGGLLILVTGYFVVGKFARPVHSVRSAETPAGAAAHVEAVSDKSIAVLPFTDMSENKDAGFFADGVHEDLLTNLALVPELQVVSRTSVMQYRGTTKTMRQIGQELGVAYVLEGSVRRAGTKIRVTAQLINTRTDQHVWAKNYDRDLTDLFNIQTTLSQEIATALSAALSPETMRRLERRPTGNTAAYDLFLQGRAVFNSAPSGNAKALNQSADFFRRAALLDPKFAAAWGELAVSFAFKEFWNIDETAELKAQGEDAIARAQALDPDSPEVIRLVGNYAYYAHRDYAKATAQYMRLGALQPNDPTVFSALGLIQRRQGHWSESLANLRKAAELDYGSIPYQRNLVSMLMIARRYPEAREVAQRLIALRPGNLDELLLLADLVYDTTDSLQAAQAILANLAPAQREDPDVIYRRKGWARDSGDLAEFKRLDEKQPYEEDGSPIVGAIFAGLVYWGAGDQPLARARVAPFLEDARKLVVSTPDNYLAWGNLGQLELLSGQSNAAMEHLAKAARLLPPSRDALNGPIARFWYLSGCAMTGRKDEALTGLAELVRQPTGIPLIDIRTSPAFLPLRGDPRFQAILNDPKSRAQLF